MKIVLAALCLAVLVGGLACAKRPVPLPDPNEVILNLDDDSTEYWKTHRPDSLEDLK